MWLCRFSGDAGNIQNTNQIGSCNFGFANGMKFTTYDKDNDLWSSNCAEQRGGGWWFAACSRSCPTCSQAYFLWLDAMATSPSCNVYTLAEARMLMKLQ